MDTRYQDTRVTALWTPTYTYGSWLKIERLVAAAQRAVGLIPQEGTELLVGPTWPTFEPPFVLADLVEIEKRTKHDVAAFVEYARRWYSLCGGEVAAKWFHYGLTSSDLVDTAQGMRFAELLTHAEGECQRLLAVLARWEGDGTAVLARTHGQPAEPIELRVRVAHWSNNAVRAMHDLLVTTRRMAVCKIAGPTGSYAHNPPQIENEVASQLGLSNLGHGASQVVPRYALSAWADSCARLAASCSKIATDIRLMNLVGEARLARPDGQVGSSSMAHKDNPIVAEQLNGMAQLAGGYASMLRPLDLWLERDISHSCVERVAVPDLWHVTLHVLKQTTAMLESLAIDPTRTMSNLLDAGTAPLTVKLTGEATLWADTIDEAKRWALDQNPDDLPMDVGWFMRHYPWEHDVESGLTAGQADG